MATIIPTTCMVLPATGGGVDAAALSGRHAPVLVDPARPAAKWQLASGVPTKIYQLADQHIAAPPRRIMSSPQDKAVQTAQILARHFGAAVEVRAGLEEHHRHGMPVIEDGGRSGLS
ncbi:histidine phosphatase family protein [Actibacterium sp. 188UL27-1]|uniref:histidine phosphatase family protein n=1 Tax=Actibacterium sp. 188UL27-1 TaxID=2786961 RepID=UPI00195A6EC1|nr:histidine phosphatase family protein [Actibacterium sp. 188UL27-1]MBM7066644.1 histidine phosphatase family protein [Actibacterium sp. 188UL27-1]